MSVIRVGKSSYPIDQPQPDPGGDWRCAFAVEGIGRSGPFETHGIDALQALTLAMDDIRNVLDESGLEVS